MMDLKRLIDLLPYYFKEADTYKDSNGKGILERFLEICGSYFDDQVTLDTESLLDNLDVEQCPEHFLQYFWEWFGCIPFAEGEFIDFTKWAQYYNGFDSKDQYNQKKSNWIPTNRNNPLPNLTLEDKRRILKYAISLIKCRGSKVFFETLFRFYGIECTSIVTPLDPDYQGNDTLEDHTIRETIMDDGKDGEYLLFDKGQKLDWDTYCSQCIPVYFTIKYTGEPNSEACKNFMQAVINFINKYIPFNAHPIVKFLDSQNNPLYGGIVYYIRATNTLNGNSALFSSQIQGNDNQLKFPVSYDDKDFTYFVEVWSSEDPKGETSTWVYYAIEGQDFSWDKLDLSQLSPRLNKSYGVVNFLTKSDLNGRHQILNLQSLKAYLQGTERSSQVAYIYLVAKDPNVNIDVDPNSNIRYEFSIKSQDSEGNETFSPSVINMKDRLFVKAIKHEYTPNSGIIDTYASIVVSPSGLTIGTHPDYDGYIEITNLRSGYYNIAIQEAPLYNGYVRVISDTFRYLVRCNPSSQTIANLEDAREVTITVEPEGVNPGTEDYNLAMELVLNDRTPLYDITSNKYYKYPEGGLKYQPLVDMKYFGTYKFICTLNPKDLQLESKYTGVFILNKDTGLYTLVRITSINPSVLNLNDTQGNPQSRTVRIDLSLYGNSNFTFGSNPDSNGIVRVKVQEDLGTVDKWFTKYASNKISEDTYEFRDRVIRISDTKAYMELEIPYVTLDDSHEGLPCTGALTFQYSFPLVGGVSPGSSNEVTCRVSYSYIVPPAVDYISIVPQNPEDTNWKVFDNESMGIIWDNYYPNENPDGSYKPCLGQAIYSKKSENSICRFTIDGLNSITYSFEPEYSEDHGFVDEVIEDTSEIISLDKPGKYTFGDPEGIWKADPEDTSESYKPMIIMVKDYEVTPSMLCSPTQKIISDNELYETAKVDRVTLTLNPDNPRANHQIAIFKVKESSRTSSGDYVVTSVEKLIGIFEAESLASGYTFNETGDFVFAWVGNFQNQDGNYTTSDWALAKDDWKEGVNFCVFSFKHQSDFITGIQVNPTQDYINTTKKTASTRVVLIGNDGKELTGSNLIKCTWVESVAGGGDVSREETYDSPCKFETDSIGTYTFSYVYKNSIKGVFEVTDVSPNIKGINILEPGISAEAPYIGPHSLSIQILDDTGKNISNDPQVTSDYLLSFLVVSINNEPLSSSGFRLERNTDYWTITFINDITWNDDGTILIGIDKGSYDEWVYTRIDPVVPSSIEISNIQEESGNNYIPGRWSCKFRIKKSDGTYMTYNEWDSLGSDKGILYIKEKEIPYGNSVPSEGTYDNFTIRSSEDPEYGTLYFNLKESPSSIYWEWSNIRSNTLNAQGEPKPNPDDYLVVGTCINEEPLQWLLGQWAWSEGYAEGSSYYTGVFGLALFRDGGSYSKEIVPNGEIVISNIYPNDQKVLFQTSDGTRVFHEKDTITTPTNGILVCIVKVGSPEESLPPYISFDLYPKNNPNKVLSCRVDKRGSQVIHHITKVEVNYAFDRSLLNDQFTEIAYKIGPTWALTLEGLNSGAIGKFIETKQDTINEGRVTQAYNVNWDIPESSDMCIYMRSNDPNICVNPGLIAKGSYQGTGVEAYIENLAGDRIDTLRLSEGINTGSNTSLSAFNNRDNKFPLHPEDIVSGETLHIEFNLWLSNS
jgi:hypothetical protein